MNVFGRRPAEQKMVSLWDLLNVICFTTPIALALASAVRAKAGFGGYALALTIGLALGVSFAWAMRTVGKSVAAHIKRHPGSLIETHAYALYFGAILWIVFASFLGDWASSVLLRLVF